WPDAVEHFAHGWETVADFDGAELHVRHGIGTRHVYGRRPLHSGTWVENNPVVEGVEADDFATPQALLSLLKTPKKHLRPAAPLPSEYRGFDVTAMRDEVHGPYSPRSLAVRLRQDDVEGWTHHAILRAAAWDQLRSPALRASLPPLTAQGPLPASAT